MDTEGQKNYTGSFIQSDDAVQCRLSMFETRTKLMNESNIQQKCTYTV